MHPIPSAHFKITVMYERPVLTGGRRLVSGYKHLLPGKLLLKRDELGAVKIRIT